MIGLALLLAAALAPGAQAHSSNFQELAPSPADLTSVAADPGTGLIYAQENNGTKYFVYDPRTNVWSELAPAPINSGNNGGATYLAGKVYVSYTNNSAEIAVYDIASNSWTGIANPLGEGTGDITSGNGLIYMAQEEAFVQYDPTTGITTPLAEPPEFADGEEGFEPWGGLQFTGTKIYGHEGNGDNDFAVYDIPTNTWTELPRVPEVEGDGAVLGSAWDPITNTYLTYGPYDGNTLFRYDIEAGSWTTGTVPFAEVEDGGMAYVGLPGIEGIYMIEGESGNAFTRYNEQNQTDLSTSMSASVTSSSTGGEITYSIQVKNNGPERASGVVLSDAIPAGTKLVSASSSQGACDAAVSCAIGVLPSGAGAGLTIKVTAGFGTVSNTATVSSKALDTNPSNDSATTSTSLAAPLVNPVKCVVPKLKGLRLKGAKKALRAAHCAPGEVTRRNSRKAGKGRVIRGAKKPGAALPAGTKVELTVSRGAKHKAHHKPKSGH
jgi:uncharacterized repeat protein (TIGR01451 family)